MTRKKEIRGYGLIGEGGVVENAEIRNSNDERIPNVRMPKLARRTFVIGYLSILS